jgi:hypothetical protein
VQQTHPPVKAMEPPLLPGRKAPPPALQFGHISLSSQRKISIALC